MPKDSDRITVLETQVESLMATVCDLQSQITVLLELTSAIDANLGEVTAGVFNGTARRK